MWSWSTRELGPILPQSPAQPSFSMQHWHSCLLFSFLWEPFLGWKQQVGNLVLGGWWGLEVFELKFCCGKILWHFPRVQIIQISKERRDSCLVGLVRRRCFVQRWCNIGGKKYGYSRARLKEKCLMENFQPALLRSLLYLQVWKSCCSAFCCGWCHIAPLLQRQQIAYAFLLLHKTNSHSVGLGLFVFWVFFFTHIVRC